MNERIKDLEQQAMTFRGGIQMLDTDKFAELIVKECASLMESEKEYYSKPGAYESREYYERMAAKEDAFDDAGRIIKSHFGVKS